MLMFFALNCQFISVRYKKSGFQFELSEKTIASKILIRNLLSSEEAQR